MSWHPTLSSIERRTDLPQDRPRPVTGAQWREGRLKSIGSWELCYCGLPDPHGWPGRDQGVPHPRGEYAAGSEPPPSFFPSFFKSNAGSGGSPP